MVRSGCCDSINGEVENFAGGRGMTLLSTAAHGRQSTIVEIDERLVCHLIRYPTTRTTSTSSRVNTRTTSHSRRPSSRRDASSARNTTQPHARDRSDMRRHDERASYRMSSPPDGLQPTFNEEPLRRTRNSSSYHEPLTTDRITSRNNSRIPTSNNGWNQEATPNPYHSSQNSHQRPEEAPHGTRNAYDAGHARRSESTSTYQRPPEMPPSRGRSQTTAYVYDTAESDSTYMGNGSNYRRQADYRTRPSSRQPRYPSERRRTEQTAEYSSRPRGRQSRRSTSEEGCVESIMRSISRSIADIFRGSRSRRPSMSKTSRHRSRSYKGASVSRARSRTNSRSRVRTKTVLMTRNGRTYQVRYTVGGEFEARLGDSSSESEVFVPGFGRR